MQNKLIKRIHDWEKQYTSATDEELQEETRNLEILALSKKQCVYYQDEEPDGGNANVWIR